MRRGIGIAAILGAVAAGASQPAQTASAPQVSIQARTLPFVRQTDERFQSFQIGFSHLTGGETWKAYDAMPKGEPGKDVASVREARSAANLMNPRLIALTRPLAPLYIRYSGTTANSAYFHDNDASPPAKAPEGYTVVLTRAGWKGAVDFARAVNARIVTSFAISEGVRDAAGTWTPRMAASWLAYTRLIGGRISAAELFNEPNAPEYPRLPKGFTPAEFARDYAVFSREMARLVPDMKLAGPGTANVGVPGLAAISGISSEDYAEAAPSPRFGIVSYHFYPAVAQRCVPETSPQGMSADRALSEEWLARPDAELARQKALRDRIAPGAPIWLTETGGAACGGLRWQPAFLDMFRYLDMQARLSKQGLDAMFTHALISGSNGVIDEKTLEPNASYWGAVLWRKLMGARVLDAGENRPGLHTYAHCLRGVRGGVALLALNLTGEQMVIGTPGRAQVYTLTSPELQSQTVLLNGSALAVRTDNRLPAMAPRMASGQRIDLPAQSISFIALPGAGNRNCSR